MNFFARLYYPLRKAWKAVGLYLVIAGPGIVVMVADNDAGGITTRGHAEAIFDGFGAFWGWFSLFDLMIVDWLTLVTEFVGMTAALAIFGVSPWMTVIEVIAL